MTTKMAKGAIITYRVINQNNREDLRQVKFISKQRACDWLTEQWPSIQKRMGAVIIDLETNTPVFYPQSDINYMDTKI
jgi:hypothetical protein|tara:strand:- start:609 stop:842 length:234 start_codon:yes stop_codon:yes gene_type:complete